MTAISNAPIIVPTMRALAAEERGAADDDRGDGVQLCAGGDVGWAELRREVSMTPAIPAASPIKV